VLWGLPGKVVTYCPKLGKTRDCLLQPQQTAPISYCSIEVWAILFAFVNSGSSSRPEKKLRLLVSIYKNSVFPVQHVNFWIKKYCCFELYQLGKWTLNNLRSEIVANIMCTVQLRAKAHLWWTPAIKSTFCHTPQGHIKIRVGRSQVPGKNTSPQFENCNLRQTFC